MCFNRLSDVWKIERNGGQGSRVSKKNFQLVLRMKELVAIVLQKIGKISLQH